MLPPDYLATVSDDVVKIYNEMNEQITADICRRIIKTGEVTDTAAWQAKQAQEAGKLFDDVVSDVAQATGRTNAEIAKLFEDAGVKSVQYDAAPLIKAGVKAETGLSPAMMNVLEANARKTERNLANLTLTTASQAQMSFINATSQATMLVQSGTMDYQTAIRRVINQVGQTGAIVMYPTGNSMSLEAAARLNILTSVNQTAGELTMMNTKRLDCEYFETSAHMGARLSHTFWQGRVFKIEGADEYPNFYDETGYGEPDGLCGCNCRHSFFPYWPDISKPAYSEEDLKRYAEHSVNYNGVKYSDYEASQIQRRYERAIRDSKRTIAGYDAAIEEADSEETRRALLAGKDHAKAVYNDRRARWTDFCKQTGF